MGSSACVAEGFAPPCVHGPVATLRLGKARQLGSSVMAYSNRRCDGFATSWPSLAASRLRKKRKAIGLRLETAADRRLPNPGGRRRRRCCGEPPSPDRDHTPTMARCFQRVHHLQARKRIQLLAIVVQKAFTCVEYTVAGARRGQGLKRRHPLDGPRRSIIASRSAIQGRRRTSWLAHASTQVCA